MQAWEFIAPNDESDKTDADHIMILKLDGIDFDIRKQFYSQKFRNFDSLNEGTKLRLIQKND